MTNVYIECIYKHIQIIHKEKDMLKIENVSKRKQTFELNHISFELPGGYIMGLIGENGAGKTTLLRIIAGLYSVDEGRLIFGGQDYMETEADIRQEIGVVFHGDMFDSSVSLAGNARRYGSFYPAYDENVLKHYANLFQLNMKKRYRQLSKGEKLKFALAFALAHKPRLLLLDEPTANFDTEFRTGFFQVLREYTGNGENSVILSTHITSDIDKAADYLLYLREGRQILFGDIERIRDAYRMAAGEDYKLRLLKERVVHLEHGEYGSKALVRNSGSPFDPALRIWEPSIEELMYHMAKGGMQHGSTDQL